MKKVILKTEEITIDGLTGSEIVGILYKDGDRGFIMKSEQGYGVITVSEKTNFDKAHKEIYFKNLLQRLSPWQYRQEWYVFNNMQELYKWLSEAKII